MLCYPQLTVTAQFGVVGRSGQVFRHLPGLFLRGFRLVQTGKEKGPSRDGPYPGDCFPVVVKGWMAGVAHPSCTPY